MPLPTLITQRDGVQNALQGVYKMRQSEAESADRRVAAEQRNSLFGLQKKKLESELDPLMLKLKEDTARAELAKQNELATAQAVKTKRETGKFFFDKLAAVKKDPELENYGAFFDEVSNDPQLKQFTHVLPNRDNYLQPDVRYKSGKSLTPEMDELFTKNYSSLVESTKRIYDGEKPSQIVKIQIPTAGGKTIVDTVAVNLAPGQSVEQYLVGNGWPEGTRTYVEGKEDKAPEVDTFTEGGNEIQKQYNPETKKWENIPGVTGGPKFKPETDKDPTVEATFVNKAGKQVVQMKDGSQWVQEGGKRRAVNDEDLVGLQRIGDVMNPLMQKALGGMAGEEGEGEGTGSSLVDKAKAWIGKKVESSEKVSTPPAKASTSADGVVTMPITGQGKYNVDAVRAEAAKAIANGKDPAGIKAKFKVLTGVDY